MRLILLVLSLIFSEAAHAQYCSADIIFDIPRDADSEEKRPDARKAYFYHSHNEPHYSKDIFYENEEGFYRYRLGTGCGFVEIRFELKRDDELMHLSFINVPGDMEIYMGEIPFRAGEFELDMREWLDRAQDNWEDAAQLSENTIELLIESPIHPYNPMFENDYRFYASGTGKLKLPITSNKLKESIYLNKKAYLLLEKWDAEKGWDQIDRLVWDSLPAEIDWPYGEGRFRFVQKFARSRDYYNWFIID